MMTDDDDAPLTFTPQTYGQSFHVGDCNRDTFALPRSWFARVFLRRKPRVVVSRLRRGAHRPWRQWKAERKLIEDVFRNGKP